MTEQEQLLTDVINSIHELEQLDNRNDAEQTKLESLYALREKTQQELIVQSEQEPVSRPAPATQTTATTATSPPRKRRPRRRASTAQAPPAQDTVGDTLKRTQRAVQAGVSEYKRLRKAKPSTAGLYARTIFIEVLCAVVRSVVVFLLLLLPFLIIEIFAFAKHL